MSKLSPIAGETTREPISYDFIESYIQKSLYDQALREINILSEVTPESDSNPKLLYLRARTELGCRNFQKAWETIKSIREDVADARVLTLRAQIEMYLGRYLESLSSANNALSKDPTVVGAYVFKAQALKHLYRDSEAADAIREGIVQVKTLHGIRSVKNDLDKSFLARLCQEYELGIKYANYVIEQAPEYASGYVHLGINYLLKFISGNHGEASTASLAVSSAAASADGSAGGADGGMVLYQEAVKALNKAIELNPKDSVAIYYLGVAEESIGNQSEALELYHRAVAMSPGYANAVLALVKIHMMRGEGEHALEHINSLVAINPSEEALLAKAKALESSASTEEALSVLDELIELNPVNHYFHYRKAIIHSTRGEHEAALIACDAALSFKAGDPYVLHQKAIVLTQLHLFPRAIETISDVLSTNPEFAMAYEAKGYILSEIVTEPIARSFAYFFSQQPRSERTSELEELIYAGEISKAEIWYYNNINRENESSFDLFLRGESFFDSGAYNEASECFGRAVEINPDFTLAYSKLAESKRKQGFSEEADAIMERVSGEYGMFLRGEGKLPHINRIESESISAFDQAISLDARNPILYSSKASALGKFQRLEEMIESAERAESMLLSGYGATLSPGQIEYIMEQNKLKLELFREIKKLASTTKLLQDTMKGGFELILVTSSDHLTPEGLHEEHRESMTEATHPIGMIRTSSARLLKSLPSMREIEMQGASYEPSAPEGRSFGSPFFLSPKAAADTGERVIGKEASSSGAYHKSSSTGAFTVTSKAEVIIEPASSSSSSSSSSSFPADRVEDIESGAVSTSVSLKHISSANLIQEATMARASSHQPKDLAAISHAVTRIHSSLKTSADRASVTVLKKEVQELKAANEEVIERYHALLKDIASLRSGLGHALAHDGELAIWAAEARAVDSDPMLGQYRDGFIKALQKFMVGCLARGSGLVGDKVYEIPGISFVPLPPIAEQIVKVLHTVGGMVAKVHEDREVSTSMNCISNPLHFATNLVPKIACKMALMPEKQAAAKYGAPEARCGIFKIVDVYEGLRDLIWQTETPTYASQLGAEDAIKIIAILKAGGLNIYGSEERDGDNITRVITAYVRDSFRGELTQKDLDIVLGHRDPASSDDGGSLVSSGTGEVLLSSQVRDSASISTETETGRVTTEEPIKLIGTPDVSGIRVGSSVLHSTTTEPVASRLAIPRAEARESWSDWFVRKICCCCVNQEAVLVPQSVAAAAKISPSSEDGVVKIASHGAVAIGGAAGTVDHYDAPDA